MPSIKVTPTKGLFQRGGTSAIPNGSLSGHKRVVTAKTGDYTLLQADCGSVLSFSGGAHTLTLPALADSKGFHATMFIASAHAMIITGPSSKLTMVSVNATETDVVERDHAFTTATLSAGAIGDRFDIYCQGDWWVLTGFTNAAVAAT
jgi:hypothetical protein